MNILHPLAKSLARAGLPLLLMMSGCASAPKFDSELSEQMRQLAEMRDTCTQYAAWIGRDFPPSSQAYRHSQQLYIEASAAANSYIEALQFDLMTGAEYSEDQYAEIADRVHATSDAFLKDARRSLEITQTRGGPLLLILPLAQGLVDLSLKLTSAANQARQRQREMLVQALSEKKWKSFHELVN